LNRNGIIALVLGLVLPIYVTWMAYSDRWGPEWLGIFAFVLFPLAAAFFGHVARRQIRGSGQPDKWGKRAGATGLVLGYGEILFCLLFVVANVVFPSHPNALAEVSAVGSLRTLITATRGYADSHPETGYPQQLADMQQDRTKPEIEWGIDPVLASGVKAGYRFTYRPKSRKGSGLMDSYEIFADPVQPGRTGVRHFYTDESRVIRYEPGGPANSNSQPLQ
jgi:type IV pilus assembly protein PilA